MAPVGRGSTSFDFEWMDDPGRAQLDYVRTVLPPKKAFLPPREVLLEFDRGAQQAAKPLLDDAPFVLVGVHPCDLKAINQLDWAMGQRHGVPDPHYTARRSAATIVGIECMPDEYCFCTSVASGDTRDGADLFLTPIEAGCLVEVLTEKGDQLLKQSVEAREATPEEEAAARTHADEKKRRITTEIEAAIDELPDLLDPRYGAEVFEETAARCYSCGTCTNVCPTCFCFDVDDEVALPPTTGTRGRRYDSCQFLDFALVAGGHNFRGERVDRVRHRWFRKFVYLLREHGVPFCVGCGRCSKFCTAGIGLVDVLNSVLAEAKEEAVP
jgi:sulfhydrogenase subunit beta (sulfur reductase)